MGRRKPFAGAIIRIAGLVLIAVAVGTGHLLFARAATPPDSVDYLLAVVAFPCASAGVAMAALGAHLFDEVEVSARWRRLGGA